MDLGSLLLGLALLLIVIFIVARPVLLHQADRERAEHNSQAEQLFVQREQLLAQLRDLDFDHATGKLAEADYAEQRAGLVAQGVTVLKQLDALGLAPVNGAAHTPEDEIEAAIAAARTRVAARRPARPEPVAKPEPAAKPPASPRRPAAPVTTALYCPNCGRAARAGDQFCGGCGQPLPVAKTPN